MQTLTLLFVFAAIGIFGQLVLNWKLKTVMMVMIPPFVYVMAMNAGVVSPLLGENNTISIPQNVMPPDLGTQIQRPTTSISICEHGTFDTNLGLCVVDAPLKAELNVRVYDIDNPLVGLPKGLPKGQLACTKVDGVIKWNTCKKI